MMPARAVSPTPSAEAAPPPVVTCRKLRPKVPHALWCRSCAMNLKKRCGGLLSAPHEPLPHGDSMPCSGRGNSGDAAALGPNGGPSKRPRGHSDLDAPGGDGGPFSSAGGGRKRSVELATPSPRHVKQHSLGAARPKKALPASAAVASGAGGDGYCGGSGGGDGSGETWVQCEGCEAWRRLPAHVKTDDLPDAW